MGLKRKINRSIGTYKNNNTTFLLSAHKFYNSSVEVLVQSEEVTDTGNHVIFRLNFDNSAYKPRRPSLTNAGIRIFPTLKSSTFFKVASLIILFE